MKVNDSNTANLGNVGSSNVGKAAETKGASRTKEKQSIGTGGSEPDRVSLSNLSGSLRAALTESPEREARLEKLSAEVSSGRYHVDSNTLSKDIVSDAFGK